MAANDPARLEPSLPRRAYLDAEFYARETQAIFLGQWVYAGRSEHLANAGDFVVVEVAGESIILVRAENGLVHGHLNFCRHRGSRLLCGSGKLRGAIRCPYHAWAYALDGALLASPFVDAGQLPAEARRLHPVAVDEWGGFLFLNASPERVALGETLAQQLGPIPQRLRRYPLAELRSCAVMRYEVAANWKVILENYNECYHCAGVHPELCKIVPAFKDRGGMGLDWERGIPHREGATTFTFSGTTARAPFATLDDDERTRHKGELIYPNFMLSLSADHAAAFQLIATAPDRTEVVCEILIHPDEPVRDATDAAQFWDVVNRQDWAICERVQAGMTSRAFRYGYYAPMEDASLDIRRYIARHLGEDAVRVES